MKFQSSDDMVAAARDDTGGATSADMVAEANAGVTRVTERIRRRRPRRSWSPERSRGAFATTSLAALTTASAVAGPFGPDDWRHDPFAPAPHENPAHPDYRRIHGLER